MGFRRSEVRMLSPRLTGKSWSNKGLGLQFSPARGGENVEIAEILAEFAKKRPPVVAATEGRKANLSARYQAMLGGLRCERRSPSTAASTTPGTFSSASARSRSP